MNVETAATIRAATIVHRAGSEGVNRSILHRAGIGVGNVDSVIHDLSQMGVIRMQGTKKEVGWNRPGRPAMRYYWTSDKQPKDLWPAEAQVRRTRGKSVSGPVVLGVLERVEAKLDAIETMLATLLARPG